MFLHREKTKACPYKRGHGALFAVVILALLTALPAAGEDRAAPRGPNAWITPAADQSIERGLTYLVERQHDDGSFGSATLRGNVAVTALAGMAFLSGGSTPGRGPHGDELARALDYILARCQPSGFIVAPEAASHGPMYGHGFATLLLAECYGMSRRGDLREKLTAAVKLIENTQNSEGGWRYQPKRADADVSVTICQVMALRSARNAGIHVPKQTIDRCTDYVKRCQNPDGGFAYQLDGRRDSLFPRSAAGVAALFSAGIYEGPEVTKGLDYLLKNLPREVGDDRSANYFYGQYYAAMVMWQAGGDRWRQWYPSVRDGLIARQAADGSWPSSYTSEYATSMACIVLQTPNNFLPIFQR
ncbi:MAG: terpene cyclase/mutase family protein [Pirellulales bacterium]|nr:terpene cyclase/mutase family protein [Pirellulales bacterium]